MIAVLGGILTQFPGPTNRLRCMAHIVNLVVQVILRRFDIPKSKSKRPKAPPPVNEDEEEEIGSQSDDELARDIDKEELEMDEGDDDDIEHVFEDVESIESAVSEEISKAAAQVKPVRHVSSASESRPLSQPSYPHHLIHAIPFVDGPPFVHGPALVWSYLA